MKPQKVDVIFFMGQSNMAGRGETCLQFPEEAEEILSGAGYEFRAISNPEQLWRLQEPFGKTEDRIDGIDDSGKKTGSLVTAFVNAYYKQTEVPVIAVSASKGGSSIIKWQPEGAFMEDIHVRIQTTKDYLHKENIQIRHIFMAWCQGETDGDHGMSGLVYQEYFLNMWKALKKQGIEKCFLILIGEYNGTNKQIEYGTIRDAQKVLSSLCQDIVIVNQQFQEMKEQGLMKDDFHYYQKAYNIVGKNAGMHAGHYVKETFL